ncbi:MAG: serine/threonine protein kinase, partial [Gammaproteobacteria bacterium]|nr:serine/threonine protein kinase [Gammaproteobacteria bacterium]
MNKIQQHCMTLITAATPLPRVIRKPELLKFWLLKLSRERMYLIAGLIFMVIFSAPLSQAIVDYLYPLDRDSFQNTMANLLNSPALRELEALRDSRYSQLMILFWGVGLTIALIILVLDLPESIKQAEQKSLQLIEQSQEVRGSNPPLSKRLLEVANSLRLRLSTPEDNSPVLESATDTGKTRVVKKAAKKVRYIGVNQRYRIDRALASGGSGVVYQAEDMVLGRKVAMKELLEDLVQDEAQAERFKVEAKALALLSHPCILPVYDLLEENGRFWIVMELLTAGTLKSRIEESGCMEINESVEIVKGIASGLGFAHEKGFVHRDIKPENILFADDGSYRITDFGIAKHHSTTIKTAHGLVLGSPAYMSPEQAAGEAIDSRSDIYSLGITMYQMVTGELPFQGDTAAVMAQHITRAADPPSSINDSIGESVDRIIIKMLEKKPD